MQALILCFVATVVAHNFITSPSRTRFANTLHPCLPRTSAMPHVYAGGDDEFQVEFVTGHGRTGYFAMIDASDEELLKEMDFNMLEEYIKEAPNGEGMKMPARKWRKFHRKNQESWDNHLLDNHYRNNKGDVKEYPMWYKGEVPSDDPVFMKRPSRFGGELKMLEFEDQHQSEDRSVVYKSQKFPHIMMAKKFTYSALQPYRSDFARFKMPEGAKSGNYVIWWYWSGYRDCIDVMYNATTKASSEDAMYGVPADQTTWERIDHCNFPDYRTIRSSCVDYVSNPMGCMETCGSEYGCLGVVTAPVILPNTVPERFRDLGNKSVLPWGVSDVGHHKDKNYRCDRDAFKHADENTYACVGIVPRAASETYEEFETTNDPTSPYYYSTCYFKRRQVTFENVPPPQAPAAIPWRTANSECLSCQSTADFESREQRTVFGYKGKYDYDWLVPKWEVAEHCINCDVEGKPEPTVITAWDSKKMDALVQDVKPKTCDGVFVEWAHTVLWEYRNGGSDTCSTDADSSKNCFKRVHLPGQSSSDRGQPTDLYRCNYAAYHDEECSDRVVLVGTYGKLCYCRLAKACCGDCVETDSRRTKTWQRQKIW